MKAAILNTIYNRFADWAALEKFCCDAACSTCCTRNVTMTSLEGHIIMDFFERNKWQKQFAEKLEGIGSAAPPKQTTNEYVFSCLQDNDINEHSADIDEKCPFLDSDLCTIYSVRPFSCRCFASEKLCSSRTTALIPDHYFWGSMAVMQIIEHLDQFNSWGIMTDVLLALSRSGKNVKYYASVISRDKVANARKNLRPAQPLPGFIIPEQFKDQISPLIKAIFTANINGQKTIEQILNGR